MAAVAVSPAQFLQQHAPLQQLRIATLLESFAPPSAEPFATARLRNPGVSRVALFFFRLALSVAFWLARPYRRDAPNSGHGGGGGGGTPAASRESLTFATTDALDLWLRDHGVSTTAWGWGTHVVEKERNLGRLFNELASAQSELHFVPTIGPLRQVRIVRVKVYNAEGLVLVEKMRVVDGSPTPKNALLTKRQAKGEDAITCALRALKIELHSFFMDLEMRGVGPTANANTPSERISSFTSAGRQSLRRHIARAMVSPGPSSTHNATTSDDGAASTASDLPGIPEAAAEFVSKHVEVMSVGAPVTELQHSSHYPGLRTLYVITGVSLRMPALPDDGDLSTTELPGADGGEGHLVQHMWRFATESEVTALLLAIQQENRTLPAHVVNPEEIDLQESIGSGAYGEVFRGVWRNTNVCVKQLNSTKRSTPRLRQDLRKEAEIMASLRHPCIVLFMGVCVTPNFLAVVMEYCERGSLFHVVHGHKLMPALLSAKLMLDVARGMGFLHAAEPQVIHCDLKSCNVLVQKDWRACVADFGISKLVRLSEADAAARRGPARPVGTLLWAAPEVLRSEPASTASDVYSFAVTLFECAARELPFPEVEPGGISWLVVTGERPDKACSQAANARMTVLEAALPGWTQLMRDCWRPEPDMRPDFPAIIEQLSGIVAAARTAASSSGGGAAAAAAAAAAAGEPEVLGSPGPAPAREVVERQGARRHSVEPMPLPSDDQVVSHDVDSAADELEAALTQLTEAVPLVDVQKLQVLSVLFPFRGGSVNEGRYLNEEVIVRQFQSKAVGHSLTSHKFAQRAELLAKLQHKNLARLVGVHVARGNLLIVTLAPTRGVLERLLESTAAPPPSERGRLAFETGLQLAAALHVLHTNATMPTVHRDVSARTVYVDWPWNVRLAEFAFENAKGITSIVDQARPVWTAPEVLRGRPATLAADVYAWAMVVWSVAAWGVPLADVPDAQLTGALVTDSQRPPALDNLAPDLAALLDRCWSADPAARPTADELLAQLRGSAPSTGSSGSGSGAKPTEVRQGVVAPPPTQNPSSGSAVSGPAVLATMESV